MPTDLGMRTEIGQPAINSRLIQNQYEHSIQAIRLGFQQLASMGTSRQYGDKLEANAGKKGPRSVLEPSAKPPVTTRFSGNNLS